MNSSTSINIHRVEKMTIKQDDRNGLNTTTITVVDSIGSRTEITLFCDETIAIKVKS